MNKKKTTKLEMEIKKIIKLFSINKNNQMSTKTKINIKN